MRAYEKPVVMTSDEIAEGVYLASGDVAASGQPGCDSKYMNGVWQDQNKQNWAPGETKGYKEQFGCLGCPANTASGCGLLTHYIDSGKAQSYDVDNGNRMPSWERKGYKPNDPVSDWNM
ncbi:MAG: hypothetical protein SO170_05085 [Butyribacter sp.]|nr:hypothetical protein [bacterium]MDY3854323.1 hypothetical protein [Butyribacter sp.]